MKLITGIVGAAAIVAALAGCGGTTTTVVRIVPGPTKTVTHTVRVPVPGSTKTVTVTPPAPTPTQQQQQPAPTPAPTQQAHAGEVYCTYERMLVADCTNGGIVTFSASAYNNALAENADDPGAVLSGWFPLSQVQSG
jgi:hypothetical protein